MRLRKTPFALALVALCGAGAIPLGAQTASQTIEAESMTLSGYVIENANRIKLSGTTGTARKNFTGQAGTYNIQVYVQAESDGRPTLAVYKGTATTPLQTFTYPLGDAATSFTIKNVVLNANEELRLVGTLNAGAPARVDKMVLTRVDTGTSGGTGAIYTGTPYLGTPVPLPRAFFARDFDRGGEGVAYHDLTAANTGGQYRLSEGVDIFSTTDTQGGGHAITNFQTGEWLAYTVNVAETKNYDLAIRASNNYATPPAFHIEVDGANVTGSIGVPKTGSWSTYQWVGKQNVRLTAGKHVLKVVSDQEHFAMSAVSVLASATQPAGTGALSVSFTSPTSGQTVSGTAVPYAATVSAPASKVEFTVSSATPVSLGAKLAPPYSGTLDTTKLENGDHTLTAVATDAQGKTSTSQVAFKVQNTAPPTDGGGTGTKPANLLFWSGFEGGVSMGAPYGCYGAGCWQDLLGTDSASGFTWPPKIGGGGGRFQARSGTNSTPSTLSDYIVNEIQTVTGRTGAPTRALHALIKRNSCTGTAGQGGCSTQDPYLLQPTREPGDLYISFWRKLQPDLLQKVVNGWHVVFAWKSTGDYRVNAQIVTYDGTPKWMVVADNVANGGLPRQEFWRVESQGVPVPIGQWFKFEVFTHRSKGADGRVWMAVNGQKLVDKFGPNIGVNSDPIDRIFLTQLYSAATYPLEQWTDDIQIWSTFPVAKAGDPWYDGVYGPH
jgi:carbohydrate binding protein with CBM6 domain/Big-like domain-containing protein